MAKHLTLAEMSRMMCCLWKEYQERQAAAGLGTLPSVAPEPPVEDLIEVAPGGEYPEINHDDPRVYPVPDEAWDISQSAQFQDGYWNWTGEEWQQVT